MDGAALSIDATCCGRGRDDWAGRDSVVCVRACNKGGWIFHVQLNQSALFTLATDFCPAAAYSRCRASWQSCRGPDRGAGGCVQRCRPLLRWVSHL